MYKLYYMPLCSLSRAAQIILKEKKLKFEAINEPIWKRRIDFLKINPEGDLPVIIDDNKNIIIGYISLAYYLDENSIGVNLIGKTPKLRLEVRRICKWINNKFYREVTENILEERVFKNLKGLGQPSTEHLKAGRINLINHENYFEWILKDRTFIAGEEFTLADIAYSSFLSSLDYLGEIKWERITNTKRWYAKIKSRPTFRDILKEKIYAIPPSKTYQNLDF
ncbi:MAG: glutathione S-transferase [Rickettsiales bacterium]|nr:glutathione S-transferase [Rickettsiales bacterium]